MGMFTLVSVFGLKSLMADERLTAIITAHGMKQAWCVQRMKLSDAE